MTFSDDGDMKQKRRACVPVFSTDLYTTGSVLPGSAKDRIPGWRISSFLLTSMANPPMDQARMG